MSNRAAFSVLKSSANRRPASAAANSSTKSSINTNNQESDDALSFSKPPHAAAAAKGQLHLILFDTTLSSGTAVLEAECDRLEKHIHDTSVINCGGSESKAFQNVRITLHRNEGGDGEAATTGILTEAQFTAAVRELGATPSSTKVLQQWMSRYDVHGTGSSCDYLFFVTVLFGHKKLPAKDARFVSIIENLRTKLIENNRDTTAEYALRRLALQFPFSVASAAGAAGSSSSSSSLTVSQQQSQQAVSVAELSRILAAANAPLPQSDVEYVASLLGATAASSHNNNTNANSSVNVAQFLTAVRGPFSSARKRLVLLAFEQIASDGRESIPLSELCNKFNAARHPACTQLGRDAGEVADDFAQVWHARFKNTQEEEEQQQQQQQHVVTRAMFVDFYKDVAGLIESDEVFEQLLRVCWG